MMDKFRERTAALIYLCEQAKGKADRREQVHAFELAIERYQEALMWALKALLPALLFGFVLVHDWYPSWCCNGDGVHGDCKPVDCDAITENKAGYYDYQGLHFEAARVFPSPDGQCHVCIRPLGPMPICAFIRPES